MTRRLVMLLLPEGTDPEDLHFICTGPGHVDEVPNISAEITCVHLGVMRNAANIMAMALYNREVEKSQ